MRNLLILIVLICSCTPEQPPVNIEERNGVMYEIETDSLFQGLRTEYHDNGNIAFRCQYKGGLMNGKAIFWLEDGTRQSKNQIINKISSLICMSRFYISK